MVCAQDGFHTTYYSGETCNTSQAYQNDVVKWNVCQQQGKVWSIMSLAEVRMLNETSTDPAPLDCHTDQQHDLVMSIVNPSKSKVKIKTCDARSVNGSTAACQGALPSPFTSP